TVLQQLGPRHGGRAVGVERERAGSRHRAGCGGERVEELAQGIPRGTRHRRETGDGEGRHRRRGAHGAGPAQQQEERQDRGARHHSTSAATGGRGSPRSTNRRINVKKSGMKSTPTVVAVSIPKKTPVPSDRREAAPAPEAMASGSTP